MPIHSDHSRGLNGSFARAGSKNILAGFVERKGSKGFSDMPGRVERPIADNSGDIQEFYDLGHHLGAGSWGSVTLATRRGEASCQKYAVKAVTKLKDEDVTQSALSVPERLRQYKRRDRVRLKQEIEILKAMNHSNIVRLIDSFEDSARVFLVMELCLGGELIDFLLKTNRHSEVNAAIIMKQIFSATEYIHNRKVMHRDLKPENILLQTKDDLEHNTIKIVDFGASTRFDEHQELRLSVGTAHYIAPQVLAGRYDKSADLWSCGVIMYVLLCGYAPFQANNEDQELQRVKRGNYSFKREDWETISEDAKGLIRKLLMMSQSDRCTATQALQHPWVDGLAPNAPTGDLQKSLVNLKSFRARDHVAERPREMIEKPYEDPLVLENKLQGQDMYQNCGLARICGISFCL